MLKIDHIKVYYYIKLSSQNQFFISSQPGYVMKVENEIMDALTERIIEAYNEGNIFRVIVVMPLKPEFPGEWGDSNLFKKSELESVSYWNYATLCKGNNSLYGRLINSGGKNIINIINIEGLSMYTTSVPVDDIYKYFSVYGLRTHGVLSGRHVCYVKFNCYLP